MSGRCEAPTLAPMLLPKLLIPDAATAALHRLRPTAAQLVNFKGHLAEMLRHLARPRLSGTAKPTFSTFCGS